ncbi:MAG: N-acetyl-gamma-glutamyl-phosphate reductase [Nitrospirae bacterium]|nr:N-acetyl-gamma-glutamyl-phosphate reductase [Nitrospirota bacterium]
MSKGKDPEGKNIRIGIVGASGYAGAELLRLLAAHSKSRVVRLAGESKAGAKIGDLFPHLESSAILEKASESPVWTDVDVVFFALPAGQSFRLVPPYLEQGTVVIDLGPDYRLRDPGLYRKVYGIDHGFPEGLSRAVYALPEWEGDALGKARLVACPGCFPTGALLGILPFLRSGRIRRESIVVDGKSGITGAGRGLSLETHFPEISEGVLAYKLLDHRHVPEMEQALEGFGGGRVTFVPHLLPFNRGILSTIYMVTEGSCSQEEVDRMIEESYRNSPFVRRVASPPNTMSVRGTNNVHIHARIREDRLVVLTAIDNLVRGAAGQAIQAMNRIFGCDETDGLGQGALFP